MARITSGAIQYGVPTNVFAGLDTEAEPKSATKTNNNGLFDLAARAGLDAQST